MHALDHVNFLRVWGRPTPSEEKVKFLLVDVTISDADLQWTMAPASRDA